MSETEIVNAEELPEDKARRYARALVRVLELCDKVEANPLGWGGIEVRSFARTVAKEARRYE